jgi:penicillin amidase
MTTIRVVRLLLAIVLLGGGIFVGAGRINQLPPLGPFLDPANGVWSVARAANLPAQTDAVIAALGDSVHVVYDRRGVPHIRATTVDDCIRALGFVAARDRMFQMELQARATAGRLTEWIGARALDVDRQQRSIGLSWSARRDLAALDSSSETARLSRLYADGVNAWLATMEPKDVPIEYRFLGVVPEEWEPINSILTYKRLGYTLSYSVHDRWRHRVATLIGREATAALFPINSPIQEPIQPNGTDEPRFDYQPIPPPPERERGSSNEVVAWDHVRPDQILPPLPLAGLSSGGAAAASAADLWGGELGSNNWAVSPSRSATGSVLLSGDPHLNLSLPSIWYEVHLQVPGELDVYGVTFPGIPSVVIGFNRDVAWSATNTGADVLDFYWETLDHETAPRRYLFDGEWRELEHHVEYFRGRDGEQIAVDTLYYTHRGPVFFGDDGPLSMRWTVLEEAGSMEAFSGAARSTSVSEFESAMESFHAPAQNWIVGDRMGNIGIRSTGRFPIRPGGGEGTEIRDGTTSQSDWLGYWPLDEYPGSRNPEQGYLASANQQPIDPQVQGRYLGVDWETPWRAMRINDLLRNDSAVTVESMSRYQTDPGNEKANLFVPAFLDAANRRLSETPDEDLAEAARLLAEWDRRYTKDNERAVLFESALRLLTNRTWDELSSVGSGRRVATPSQTVLAALLQHPESPWWDQGHSDDVVETRDELLTTSLIDALHQVTDEYGPPEDGGWRWSGIRQTNIWHLLGFPALSASELPVQGGSGNLNPSSGPGTHGASWRMVVELGDRVQAWVTYPGGQSGNPVSDLYDNRIQQWVDGILDGVLFPDDPGDLADHDVLSELTLKPEGY